MHIVRTFLAWLLVSSADPSKWALTVRGALQFGVAYLVKVLAAACGLGLVCLSIEADLASGIDQIVNIVAGLAMIVTGARALYGLVRKLYRTMNGMHLGID